MMDLTPKSLSKSLSCQNQATHVERSDENPKAHSLGWSWWGVHHSRSYATWAHHGVSDLQGLGDQIFLLSSFNQFHHFGLENWRDLRKNLQGMETSPVSYVIFMTESARWDLFLCSAGCPTLETRGRSFVVVPIGCVGWAMPIRWTQGQGSGGGTGLWHHCKRCHLQPAARNLWAGGQLALVLKKLYLFLVRWIILI